MLNSYRKDSDSRSQLKVGLATQDDRYFPALLPLGAKISRLKRLKSLNKNSLLQTAKSNFWGKNCRSKRIERGKSRAMPQINSVLTRCKQQRPIKRKKLPRLIVCSVGSKSRNPAGNKSPGGLENRSKSFQLHSKHSQTCRIL